MNNRKLETQAGIFVLLGAALVGGMVLYFSALQEKLSPRYELTILFSNASGLVQDSVVFMAGAKIGRVTEPPKIDQTSGEVRVALKVAIDDDIKIREGSKWVIGSSGLLGDRFVEVKPNTDTKAGFIRPGQTIKGARTPDIADIAEKLEPLIVEAKAVAGNLKEITGKINNSLLTEQNSEEISSILIEIDDIMRRVNTALEKGELDVILADFRSILADLRKLFNAAGSGVGPLYEIMADPETGYNLAAFIANLRTHGILFYSDTYEPGDGTGKNAKKKVEASAVKTPRELRQ